MEARDFMKKLGTTAPIARVLVLVDGGVVRRVIASAPVDVLVIDYDDIRLGGTGRIAREDDVFSEEALDDALDRVNEAIRCRRGGEQPANDLP